MTGMWSSLPFYDCTTRSVLLTLVGAGGRAARPPRAPGRARAGRRQPQLAAPVRARRTQGALKPKRVARRNPAAPTTCVPTPRGRQRAVPPVAPGDGQGRAPPAPRSADLRGQHDQALRAWASELRVTSLLTPPCNVDGSPVSFRRCRSAARPGSRHSRGPLHARTRHR